MKTAPFSSNLLFANIGPTDGAQIVETLEPSGAEFYDLVLKKPLRDMEKVLKPYELYDRWSLVL